VESHDQDQLTSGDMQDVQQDICARMTMDNALPVLAAVLSHIDKAAAPLKVFESARAGFSIVERPVAQRITGYLLFAGALQDLPQEDREDAIEQYCDDVVTLPRNAQASLLNRLRHLHGDRASPLCAKIEQGLATRQAGQLP